MGKYESTVAIEVTMNITQPLDICKAVCDIVFHSEYLDKCLLYPAVCNALQRAAARVKQDVGI